MKRRVTNYLFLRPKLEPCKNLQGSVKTPRAHGHIKTLSGKPGPRAYQTCQSRGSFPTWTPQRDGHLALWWHGPHQSVIWYGMCASGANQQRPFQLSPELWLISVSTADEAHLTGLEPETHWFPVLDHCPAFHHAFVLLSSVPKPWLQQQLPGTGLALLLLLLLIENKVIFI